MVYPSSKGSDYSKPARLNQDANGGDDLDEDRTEIITIFSKSDDKFIYGTYSYAIRFQDMRGNESIDQVVPSVTVVFPTNLVNNFTDDSIVLTTSGKTATFDFLSGIHKKYDASVIFNLTISKKTNDNPKFTIKNPDPGVGALIQYKDKENFDGYLPPQP